MTRWCGTNELLRSWGKWWSTNVNCWSLRAHSIKRRLRRRQSWRCYWSVRLTKCSESDRHIGSKRNKKSIQTRQVLAWQVGRAIKALRRRSWISTNANGWSSYCLARTVLSLCCTTKPSIWPAWQSRIRWACSKIWSICGKGRMQKRMSEDSFVI